MRRAPAAHLTDQQRHARAGRQLPPPAPPVVGDKVRYNRTASQNATSAQDHGIVAGSVILTTPNGIGAILQNIGNGHGPANRVKAARSMTGIPYLQQTGVALRAGSTPEALKYMDCSEFVSRVLAIDGITNGVLPMNTGAIKALLTQKDRFAHSNTPQVGDIALWEGHVGIVSAVGAGNTFKMIHASGKGKLSSENPIAIKPEQYRSGVFYGYYRPLHEQQQGYAGVPINASPVVFTRSPLQATRPASSVILKRPTRASVGGYRSDADGTFPLEEVVVRSAPDSTYQNSSGFLSPTLPKLNAPPTLHSK